MKNTITILTLLSSLLAMHAGATPVQLYEDCHTSEVVQGVVTSISKPEVDPKRYNKPTFSFNLNLLADNKREGNELSNSHHKFLYNGDLGDSVEQYSLLREHYEQAAPVSGFICNQIAYIFKEPGKNDLLTLNEPGITVSDENYSNPLGNDSSDPETPWHKGRALRVTRQTIMISDLPKPVCRAVVEKAGDVDGMLPEAVTDMIKARMSKKPSKTIPYADSIYREPPEIISFSVKSNEICAYLESSVLPMSSIQFQYQHDSECTVPPGSNGKMSRAEVERCLPTITAVRDADT